MSRFFEPISEVYFCEHVEKALAEKYSLADKPRMNIRNIRNNKILNKDIKVKFDFENYEVSAAYHDKSGLLLGVHTLKSGLTFWGMVAGGDWEPPVYFILYWDGKNVRGYVPTEGNLWNTDTNMAFGNDPETDYANVKKRWPEFIPEGVEPEDYDDVNLDNYNITAMLADIQDRILPKGTVENAGLICPVCRITNIAVHPLAPNLRIANVDGNIVVVGDHYDEGEMGFYIPVGAKVPEDLLKDMWLEGKLAGSKKNQVKARDMKGVLSMGLFYGSRFFVLQDGQKVYTTSRAWNPNWVVGHNVATELGIT